MSYPRTNTTSTITIISTAILPTNILCRIWTSFVWMNHWWILPTMRSYKISTISIGINFLGGKVVNPRSHTTFNISKANTKWITTQITNWIFLTGWWSQWGCYTMTLRWTKAPIMPVFANINFLGVEVGFTQKSLIKIVSTSSLSVEGY